MTHQNKAREAHDKLNGFVFSDGAGPVCAWVNEYKETIRCALSTYERLQRVDFDTVKEIEERWGDRFLELEEPAPKGTKRMGYVVDIHFLLTQLKAARLVLSLGKPQKIDPLAATPDGLVKG